MRIEFFDDELDSIRAVDVMSQRSQGNMQEVVIPPASEAPVPQAGTEALARLLLEALARQEAVAKKGESGKSDDASLADLPLEEGEIAAPEAFTRENRTMERFGEKLRAAVSQMQNGVSNRMLEKFINLLYPQTETILDYMNRPIVVLDEPEALGADRAANAFSPGIDMDGVGFRFHGWIRKCFNEADAVDFARDGNSCHLTKRG